jgi:flagellar protein FliT
MSITLRRQRPCLKSDERQADMTGSPSAPLAAPGMPMDPQLLNYYEAIERASADMLCAAREGNWDEVVKLEGACVLLISQLKNAAEDFAPAGAPANPQALDTAKAKSRIMQRILVNDAEIRHLAEPWLQDLDDTLCGRRNRSLH